MYLAFIVSPSSAVGLIARLALSSIKLVEYIIKILTKSIINYCACKIAFKY